MAARALTLETREYVTTMVNTIKNSFSGYNGHKYNLEFERIACGCLPHRQEQAKLKGEIAAAGKKFDVRIEKLQKQIDDLKDQRREAIAPLSEQNLALQRQITEIDRRDHPAADALFREIPTWIRYWVIEKVTAGKAIPSDPAEARSLYLTEVAGGWRPKAPEKIFTEPASNGKPKS